MEIKYLGGIAGINGSDKLVSRRVERFLETANLIKTPSYIIDVDNLFKRKFMCCKENCDFYIHHKTKKLFGNNEVDWVDKGCCYGGSLEIPEDLIQRIDDNLEGILEFTDPECKAHILKAKNTWKKKISKELTGVGTLPKDGRCLFTTIKDGMPLCALHAYALSVGEDVLTYKPFECYLYPLDFIEIDGKVLITSIDNNGMTQGFLRWGNEHLSQGCQLKQEHGIPMYEFGKDSIIRVLGNKAYSTLDKLYKKGEYK